MKEYKNVFLDLDDTVLDFKKGQHDALFLACGEFGLSITENDYKEYDRINKESWKKFERGELEKAQMLVDRYRRFLNYKNAEGDPAELNVLYGKYLSQQGVLLPGAKEGVEYLRHKYSISIITNGNVNTQKGRLKAVGMEDTFDHVFISDEIGFRKPDLAFFNYALEKSGALKEETIVIGDSPSSDILGARNCGLDAILFDYKGTAECPYPYLKRVRTWTEICSTL